MKTFAEPHRLSGLDFARHNEETRQVWKNFRDRVPRRTPVIWGTNSRYFLTFPGANPKGWTFETYSQDPDVMFEALLRFSCWSRHNLLQDMELGIPEVWTVTVDFQNYYEAAWFGCPIHYREGQVPDTEPAFKECPERVMENGIPDPFGGLFSRGLEYYEHFLDRSGKETYLDRPIQVGPPFLGSDGIVTVACNLFGPEFVCTAMALEPERLHRLFDFLTEATIVRIGAWRERAGLSSPTGEYWYADDSLALISTSMYRDHVLPYHRRIYDALAGEAPRCIHLCGDATRHFPLLKEELGIGCFDTGFPVDFAQLREDLGDDVIIEGGPRAYFLQTATPDQVYEETRRILESGVLRGGLFILREGNNLSPHTPLENTEAVIRAGRDFGTADRF